MQLRWLAVVAVLASCGDDWKPAPDGFHGGDRLRARFLTAEGGARQLLTFHDTELDTDCYFSGDPVRCVPTPLDTDVGYYADPQCTRRVAVRSTDPCAQETRYAATFVSTGCASSVDQLWRIGARRADDAPVYTSSGDACVETTLGSATAAFDLGDEIPVDRLATATPEHVGADRLRAITLVSEDGARQPTGAWDEQLGIECYPYTDRQRCVPTAAWASYYVDDACSVPAAAEGGTCTPTPRFVQDWRRTGACAYDLSLYEVGPSVVPQTLWNDDGGACAPLSEMPTVWTVAAEVPEDSLAFVQATRVGTGRLQMSFVAGDGDYLARGYGFHDTSLDRDCYAQEIGDGTYRCIPTDVGYTLDLYYDDAACTRPVRTIEAYADSCAGGAIAVPDRVLGWTQGASCVSTAHLYQRGVEIQPGEVYVQDLDSCMAATWDPAEVRRWYLGAELDLADYALLRETTAETRD